MNLNNNFKQDILNEVDMCLDPLKDDVGNVKTNRNIKQSYNFTISEYEFFKLYIIYLYIYIVYANEV